MPKADPAENLPLNRNTLVTGDEKKVTIAYNDEDADSHDGGGKVGGYGGTDNAHARQSFVATMWNPMNDDDKLRFNQRRLIQLCVGIFLGVTSGSAYAFGVFSNRIKASAGFSQSDMTTITTVGSLMNGFTFPAGVLYDYAGPQYVLGVSTFVSCSGFILLALIFQNIVEPTVYSVAIANGLTNWGSGFNDCGSMMTNLFNLPINRGEVLVIQKTFFGLGSTYLSLAFDGFFGASDNYLGYCIFVCIFVFVSGCIGTAITRLPKYKRTTLDLKRIAKLDPIHQELERQQEETSFELFHNPRLVDRRRLNAGVTCLFFTLIFFSTFSIVKAYVEIPTSVVTGLTVLACVCLVSFFVMVLPCELPAFFDYEFLPDLHPPEELVDKPKPHHNKPPESSRDRDDTHSNATREYAVTAPILENHDDNVNGSGLGHEDGRHEEGRASSFLPQRASVAGNSAPIALPEGVDVTVIPSVKTGFSKNILQPIIWCFWLSGFAMFGSNTVLVQNLTQVFTAANDGVYDKSLNSLIVALTGVGSAVGRLTIGFLETYNHRRNALLREEQLVYKAKLDAGLIKPDEKGTTAVDMSPLYHRWNSSILTVFPICPATMLACAVLLTFCPVGSFAVIYFVSGVAMGMFLACFALGIREIFSCDVAKHYNFVGTAGMLSSVLLNRFMFGMWYDKETEDSKAADGVSCKGTACFSGSFLVLAGLCGMAMCSCAFIVFRWWQIRKTF